ncbi:hypothetical protein [Hymenobacter pini]|uniref:hypothetical protein n=1 Tax=Hymenobacter pini TaxID=2880879 RepID=UPI001CF2D98C|nr:hypothetical protein [Hymenobacter pini]MCA8831390.1 hypothetical protein [Hymenobacter pini]
MDIEMGHGKTVVMKALHQAGTYSGLLEGLPTTRMNKEILRRVKDSARRIFYAQDIFLIEPVQKLLKREKWYVFGKPAILPKIQCIAELYHPQPARNHDMHFSALTVIWYQDSYALPIYPEVVRKLKELPWDDIAGDFEY